MPNYLQPQIKKLVKVITVADNDIDVNNATEEIFEGHEMGYEWDIQDIKYHEPGKASIIYYTTFQTDIKEPPSL